MNPNRDIETSKAFEDQVAWEIEYGSPRRVITMPKYSCFDFILATKVGQAKAAVEFRHRPDTSIEAFPDIWLDLAKAEKIRKICELTELIPVFMVKWKDTGLMWTELNGHYPTARRERNDPERPTDRAQDVCLIPTSDFREFMPYPNLS